MAKKDKMFVCHRCGEDCKEDEGWKIVFENKDTNNSKYYIGKICDKCPDIMEPIFCTLGMLDPETTPPEEYYSKIIEIRDNFLTPPEGHDYDFEQKELEKELTKA